MICRGVPILVLALCFLSPPVEAASPFTLQTNDVVAFLGGGNTVAAQETGHLETLLTAAFHGRSVRYRSFAWEADTVFAQRRDLNFPTLPQQLNAAGVTVIFACFGQNEVLNGASDAAAFRSAYDKLLRSLLVTNRQAVLVTPPPFEKSSGLLPDLTRHNAALASFVAATGELAAQHGCRIVDLFSNSSGSALTDNGFSLTPRGQGEVAATVARLLGLGQLAQRAGPVDEQGRWTLPGFENLRRTIVAKNRLWFDYSRPMNWAFLAGDRTEQLSSRDHRDPKIRWFPTEMTQFLPLIHENEVRIELIASQTSPE